MQSVRLRLLLLALLPLVVLIPLLLGGATLYWIDKFDELLIAKVASDLRIAEQYLNRIEDTQAAEVAALAQSIGFARAQRGGPAAQAAFLDRSRAVLGLDFLLYGRPDRSELPAPAVPVAAAATAEKPSAALALFSADDLASQSPALADQARLRLVPTKAARPITRDTETRGMVLLTAHRLDRDDAVLVGGRLLNRNLDFIDTINALIYRDAEGGVSRAGTTTLFLDDVRISTNVRLFEGSRALGTRVSEVVWRSVIERGETWLDRAFVVNDWYISGYLPVTDIAGDRIGMLYTGFLQAPFTAERNKTIVTLILAFVAVVGLSFPIFLRLARGVFRPLEQMSETMERVEKGALDARIGAVKARDEIGAVARHLDRLLDQAQERDEALRAYAGKLNELVDQRTEELREVNRKLEATFQQLVMSEKLAAVGEITAGVAHEINNPVSVIQGNLDVLRQELGHAQTAHKTELDLIDAQTHRINIIVGKLLNFTRQGEMSDAASVVDLKTVVQDAQVLVAADLRKHDIATKEHHRPAPSVRIVASELQQVLVNLMINAAQAMPGGGTITLETGPARREGVAGAEVSVADTGTGIDADKIAHVFDPFFTTKPAEGTGLGLSISQSLISRAGGLISVRSEKGRGSNFSVWLPAADISSGFADHAAQ